MSEQVTSGSGGAAKLGGAQPARASGQLVTLRCGSCWTGVRVPRDAPSFRCGACNASNYFFGCSHCGAASQVASTGNQPPTKWECEWCLRKTSLPLFGRMPVQSAGETKVAMQARAAGVRNADPLTLGGFIVAGSSGSSLALGAICSVSMVEDGVAVHVPEASLGVVFPWEEIETLEVSGRGPEHSGTAGQPGSGALATLLSAGSGRAPAGDTVLRIGAGRRKLVLRHPRQTREQLRSTFGPMLARWSQLRSASASEPEPSATLTGTTFDTAVEQLERLLRLRAAGGIGDGEFDKLRQRYVQQLQLATDTGTMSGAERAAVAVPHAVTAPQAAAGAA